MISISYIGRLYYVLLLSGVASDSLAYILIYDYLLYVC